MNSELELKIEFSKILSEKKQLRFCDSLIEEIEKLQLRAGGSLNPLKLDWIIDYSDSSLSKGEMIDKLTDVLLSYGNFILNFEIK